jgi:hypothetical protein
MPMLSQARSYFAALLMNDGPPVYMNSTNARLAVGTSTQAFNAADTDLVGTKFRKGMDNPFPTRSNNVVTYRATFDLNEANFAWNEWGVANAASGGMMINRRVESLGEKNSTQTWIFTATLTITSSS